MSFNSKVLLKLEQFGGHDDIIENETRDHWESEMIAFLETINVTENLITY